MSQLTEKAVAEWLVTENEKLTKIAGQDPMLGFCTYRKQWVGMNGKHKQAYAATLAELAEKLKGPTPAEQAAEARKEAADLLAKAEELEGRAA